MKKILTILFIILLLVTFLGTLGFLYKKSQKPPEVYKFDKPFITNIVKKTVATGSILPRKEIKIKPQVSGIIEKLYVQAGDAVNNNQLIAKIKIIPNVVTLNNAEEKLNTAKINFNNANRELKRQRKLFDTKVISEIEFNRYLLDFQLRKEELGAAENNYELVKKGSSKKSGTVSNMVRSTVSGMILDVPVKEGSFVIESNTFNEGTTIVTIADMNSMIFEGNVDESEVGKIKGNMLLNIKIGAFENQTFKARLEFISPKGIEVEGAIQFQIKAAVSLKKNTFLRAGYSATADIVLDKREKVLAIKESDIVMKDGKFYVDILEKNQKLKRKEIKTGLSDGINIQILSGLTIDNQIKRQ